MSFLTELHAHTSEVSPCGHCTADEVADYYVAAGYTTIVVTNHYCDYVMDYAGETWEERFAHFVSGYRKMKDYAGDKLHVILGMELRFTENLNDYLIFGFNEDFLYTHPDLHKMTVVPPALLDGIEVFNGHPGHDSRNRIALEWCRRYGKIPTSGSDFHHERTVISGGIVTDEPICSMRQLTDVLRSGNYTLRCTGPATEFDGMHTFPASKLAEV